MDITFNCNKCGQPLAIDEAGAGQLVDCPKCGTPLEVPYKSKPLNKPGTPPATSPASDRASSPLPKILTGVVIIILIIVGGFFAYNFWKGQQAANAKTAADDAMRDFTVDVFLRTKGGENMPPQQNLWVSSGSGSRPRL